MTSDLRRGPLLALLLVVASCATARPPAYETGIRIESVPAPAAVPDELPPLPVSILDAPMVADRRIERIDIVDQDVSLVVRSVAESLGLNYQIDPAVSGRVTARLSDVTLQEALDAIVLPSGATYTLQDNVLRVVPARFAMRIFSLDYMSMSRIGTGTTVVQRRLGAVGGVAGGGLGGLGGVGGGLGGFGGVGGFGGGDIIQSVSVADLWEEIRVSLEALVFEGESTSVTTATGPTSLPGQQGLAGSGYSGAQARGAFSRTSADGRRLIINPLAGTILISAPPSLIADAEALLEAIEGSVHRQVLIEARIVEVALNREFQFGVDWSALQRLGNVAIQFGTGAAGTQLMLDTGPDADRQIGLVLRALESQGDVNVLSAPRVSVLNNQRATINVATDEVFFSVTRQPLIGPTGVTIGFETQIIPQQIAVGIVLDVLAQIALDNTITMNVRPVITDVVEVREVRLDDGTQASAPVIDRRETDTVVRVRGGETIVIGGLMRSSLRTERTGIPGLNRVPGIGRLFGGYRERTDKRELVIFITPTIVAGQPPLAR